MNIRDDAQKRLRIHIYENLKWAIENPEEAQIILLLYYFSCFDKQFSQLFDDVIHSGRKRILELLLAGQREGLFRFKLDVELVCEMLHDAIMGAMFSAVASRQKKSGLSAGKQKLEALIDSLTSKK
jgi:hypothetical protein